jgi:hypothetical protein
MPHNVNRKPVYLDRSKQSNRNPRVNFKKIGIGILKWTPLWIPMAFLMWHLIPDIVDHYRLKHNYVATTALVESKYKGGLRKNLKMVKYYFYVSDSLYYGHTSPPKSMWDQLQPHDQFDIVYEKDNPNNSNWAGYYKDKQ